MVEVVGLDGGVVLEVCARAGGRRLAFAWVLFFLLRGFLRGVFFDGVSFLECWGLGFGKWEREGGGSVAWSLHFICSLRIQWASELPALTWAFSSRYTSQGSNLGGRAFGGGLLLKVQQGWYLVRTHMVGERGE